jgi:hypothetical protein
MNFIKRYLQSRRIKKLTKKLREVDICNTGIRDTTIIASDTCDELMLQTLIEKTRELNGYKLPTKH